MSNRIAEHELTTPSPNGSNGHAPPATDGRDPASGKFVKGWKGGPGNPAARAVAARRKALLDAVSPEDVGRVARKLCEQALAGDVAASKVLLSYVVGRPAEVPNPDTLDLQEFQLLAQNPTIADLNAAANRVTAGFAAASTQAHQPADNEAAVAMSDRLVEQGRAELKAQLRRMERMHEGMYDSLEDIADEE